MEVKIKSIAFQFRNQISRRRVKVTMKSGNKIYIVPCHESWEQYGGIYEELQKTCGLADKCNGWLHGGKMPKFGGYLVDLINS
jgi:hypothetical protein